MSKILITGGLGYLGRQLVDRLLKNPGSLSWKGVSSKDTTLVLLDRHDKHDIASEQVEVLGNLDLNSSEATEIIARGNFDTIFHLASYVSQACYDDPSLGEKNVEAMKHILDAGTSIHAATGKRPIVVFPSSYLVFEKKDEDYYEAVADDTTVPNAEGPYGKSKRMSEKLGQQYSASVDFRVIRLPTVIAPRQPTSAATAYAYSLPNKVFSGQDCVVPVPKEYRMPFVWVDDVMEGFIKLHNLEEDTLSTRVMNMAGHSPTTQEWAELIEGYRESTPQLGKTIWNRDERAWKVLGHAIGRMKGDCAESFGIFPKTELKEMIENIRKYIVP